MHDTKHPPSCNSCGETMESIGSLPGGTTWWECSCDYPDPCCGPDLSEREDFHAD